MKTGKLFEICFKIPFYFKKLKEKDKKNIEKIAKDFGIAFQIRDDIEDKEGDMDYLRKKLEKIYLRMKRRILLLGKKCETLLWIVDKIYKEF
jgi:geranylgeranyl pyrophosphate synthase